MVKVKGEIDEMGLSEFGEDEKKNGDNEKFNSIMKTFFGIKDEIGLTKTDLSIREIKPLIKLLQHSKNLTPKYNDYLEEIGEEEKKMNGEYIQEFVKNYIKGKVSKQREGRKEGKEALKREMQKEEEEKKEDKFKEMIEELNR